MLSRLPLAVAEHLPREPPGSPGPVAWGATRLGGSAALPGYGREWFSASELGRNDTSGAPLDLQP